MAAYVVTGPLAVVTDRAGKVRYYYTGASIPGDISAEQLDRLTGRGLISKVDEPIVLLAEADSDPPVDERKANSSAGSVKVERPAQVAAKPLWVHYAVSRGADPAKAEAMTKQELADAYPPE